MLKKLELIEHAVDRLLCSNLEEGSEWVEWHKTVFNQLKKFIRYEDSAFSPRDGMEYDVCFELDLEKFLVSRFAECLNKICLKLAKSNLIIETLIEYTFKDGEIGILDVSKNDQGEKNLKRFLSKENTFSNRVLDSISKARESMTFSKKDFIAWLRDNGV